jgi:hypothetical protein
MELDAALASFTALGALADVTRVDPLRPQRGKHGLTEREVQVLRLVATGRAALVRDRLFRYSQSEAPQGQGWRPGQDGGSPSWSVKTCPVSRQVNRLHPVSTSIPLTWPANQRLRAHQADDG